MYRVKPPRTNHPEHIDNNITVNANYYPDLNIIYINTAKNASTALLSWCGGNRKQVSNNNLESSIVKFWVLRNPLDRIVSSFFEVRKLIRADKFLNTLPDETSKSWLDWAFIDGSIVDSFNLFLDSIQNNNFYDRHTFPQIIYLTDCGFNISQVETLLFDSLSVDLDNFCKRYLVTNPRRFKIQNRTMNPQKRVVKSHVDSNLDVQNKIKEIYKEDWNLYNKIKNSRLTL